MPKKQKAVTDDPFFQDLKDRFNSFLDKLPAWLGHYGPIGFILILVLGIIVFIQQLMLIILSPIQ